MPEEYLGPKSEINEEAYQEFLIDLFLGGKNNRKSNPNASVLETKIRESFNKSVSGSIENLKQVVEEALKSSDLTTEQEVIVRERFNFMSISGSDRPVNSFWEISQLMPHVKTNVITQSREHLSEGRTYEVFRTAMAKIRNPRRMSPSLVSIKEDLFKES